MIEKIKKIIYEKLMMKKSTDNNFGEVHKPWGFYQNLYIHPNFKIKKIFVHPLRRLSLQKHQNRQEHWFVLYGNGLAIIDNKEIDLEFSVSVDISENVVHRLINNDHNSNLVIIEIQTGKCDENDIIRIEDDYGRVLKPIKKWW